MGTPRSPRLGWGVVGGLPAPSHRGSGPLVEAKPEGEKAPWVPVKLDAQVLVLWLG